MSSRVRFSELGFVPGRLPPGRYNAITDVPDVRVGHVTLVSGDGELRPGQGPIRTGVTVILPHSGDVYADQVAVAIEVFNGSGEIAGLMFANEMGLLDTPIALTNSFNVPLVADALMSEMFVRYPGIGREPMYCHPVVAECSDAVLNDIQGRHVRREHVARAWAEASSGPVVEGCVGAATGLVSYDFKSGIGTASRVVPTAAGEWRVGVMVTPNHGRRHELRVGGVAVGELITDRVPSFHQDGSIIVVVATDAPLTSHGLRRLARRGVLGLARTGATSGNSSGDAVIAFSTANRFPVGEPVHRIRELANEVMDPLFTGCVEAVEEAILNALCMAETMRGRDGNTVYAIPLDLLQKLLGGDHVWRRLQ